MRALTLERGTHARCRRPCQAISTYTATSERATANAFTRSGPTWFGVDPDQLRAGEMLGLADLIEGEAVGGVDGYIARFGRRPPVVDHVRILRSATDACTGEGDVGGARYRAAPRS